MSVGVVEGRARLAGLGAWRGVLSAFCASLIGIGLARFAYTPLLPAIVAAHWFPASAAAYLGAANLAGYLAGALLGRGLAARLSAPAVIKSMLVLATLTFFASAVPVSFLWFFVWRFASGLAGGVLMVLAAPWVLAHVPAAKRGRAGGVIFMGVGIGIAASGTLVPLLLKAGLSVTWAGLGVLALLMTLVSWQGWPSEDHHQAAAPAHQHLPHPSGTLRALYAEYALNAVGLVPHMIFLVVFVARGLGEGLQMGALYWVLFGAGAVFGPLAVGHLADKTGFRTALRLTFFIEALAVISPAFLHGTVALGVSSVVVGAFTPGIVPLVLGRLHELLPHHPAEQKAAWSRATVAFALFQAGGAYGLSFVFAQGGGYDVLFIIGAVALSLSLAIDLAIGAVSPRRAAASPPS
jgi:predicted MFS family arabinose efflux permease